MFYVRVQIFVLVGCSHFDIFCVLYTIVANEQNK